MRLLTGQAIADEGSLRVLEYELPRQAKEARAVGSEQPKADPGGHVEVEPVHRGDGSKALHDPSQLDHGHAGSTLEQGLARPSGEAKCAIFIHAYKEHRPRAR